MQSSDVTTPKRIKWQALAPALAVLALAVIQFVTFMILANPGLAILGYLAVGLAFVVGIILVLISLVVNVRRYPPCWRVHIVALAIFVGISCSYYLVGSFLYWLHWRTNLVLAMTGGRDELQSWAVGVLRQKGQRTEHDMSSYVIDRQDWPRQVRWLHPAKVTVTPIFKDNQEGVLLVYPMPHEPLGIVIGPPGTVPPDDADKHGWWRQFGDGLYYWSS